MRPGTAIHMPCSRSAPTSIGPDTTDRPAAEAIGARHPGALRQPLRTLGTSSASAAFHASCLGNRVRLDGDANRHSRAVRPSKTQGTASPYAGSLGAAADSLHCGAPAHAALPREMTKSTQFPIALKFEFACGPRAGARTVAAKLNAR